MTAQVNRAQTTTAASNSHGTASGDADVVAVTFGAGEDTRVVIMLYPSVSRGRARTLLRPYG